MTPRSEDVETIHNRIAMLRVERGISRRELAEALGVVIYPGFAASETIIEEGQVRVVVAGVMRITRDGAKGPDYQPGLELRGRRSAGDPHLVDPIGGHRDRRDQLGGDTVGLPRIIASGASLERSALGAPDRELKGRRSLEGHIS